MFGSRWVRAVGMVALFAGAVRMEGAQRGKGACLQEVFEGEVRAGHSLERPIGGGLKVMFESAASGWIVRVLPANGSRPMHDYAELATPPYQSVNPLLLSTDFSFRAQDAVGWNPRRFRFAPDADAYARLLKAYQAYQATKPPSAVAQGELVKAVGQMPEGSVEILDAALVPGTADQTRAAAAVAAHFLSTAHNLDQPRDGKATPLGKIDWVRFRLRLEVPIGFRTAPGDHLERNVCE